MNNNKYNLNIVRPIAFYVEETSYMIHGGNQETVTINTTYSASVARYCFICRNRCLYRVYRYADRPIDLNFGLEEQKHYSGLFMCGRCTFFRGPQFILGWTRINTYLSQKVMLEPTTSLIIISRASWILSVLSANIWLTLDSISVMLK